MLTVTTPARERLFEMKRTARLDHPDMALRVVRHQLGEFGFLPDVRKMDDQVVEYEGTAVLLIGTEIGEKLSGVTLDCAVTPKGSRLVIRQSRRRRRR